jgi:hypothetical protein
LLSALLQHALEGKGTRLISGVGSSRGSEGDQ